MKIDIPVGLSGKELTTFLLANKSALIEQKKSMPVKFSDTLQHKPSVKYFSDKTGSLKDNSSNNEDPTNSDKIHVTAVANVFNYMDSQYDVLLPGCCKRTIKERAGKFQQLHDHIYKLEAKIGEVTNVYEQNITLSELGIDQSGFTIGLIFEFDCFKSYNEQIFNQYKAGKVDQYSIGLNYVSIDLAINDPDSPKEIDFWNKNIGNVINRDAAEEVGFFFVVSEIKLLENSAVLFGANDLTFTMAIAGKSIQKSVATYSDSDSAEDLMYVDKMMRKHNKVIATASDCKSTDMQIKQCCETMKSTSQTSLNHLQQIKTTLLQGKSLSIPDTHENDPSPVVIDFANINKTKFINLN